MEARLEHVLLFVSVLALAGGAAAQFEGTPWKAVQLDVREWVTCAVLEGGQLKCWGDNTHGQLGQGDNNHRGNTWSTMGNNLKPIPLAGPVAQVAAGAWHVCARLVNGSVQCWGHSSTGRLGYGSVANHGSSPESMGAGLPIVDLGTGKTAARLVAGWHHTCALLTDGTLKCWGDNDQGQLGQGDLVNRGGEPGQMGDALLPIRLPAGRRIANISAGGTFTCVLLDDQSVRCWGNNNHGQLGFGLNVTSWGGGPDQMGDSLPLVNLGGPVLQLSAGNEHACALLTDNSVRCWGSNANAQLGGTSEVGGDVGFSAGDMGANLKPVLPPGSPVAQVAAGRVSSCAVMVNGTAVCWGSGEGGCLGVDDTLMRWAGNLTPVKLEARVSQIEPGGFCRACARLVSGLIQCWGYSGDSGSVGVGTKESVGGSPGDMNTLPVVNLGTTPALLPPPPSPPRVLNASGSLPTSQVSLEPVSKTVSKKVEVPIGAIIGGVAGGVLLVAAIALGVCLVVRHKRKAASRPVVVTPPITTAFDRMPLVATASSSSKRGTLAASKTDYDWMLAGQADSKGSRSAVQAGIHDVGIDTARQWTEGQGWTCPVHILSSAQVKQQIKLIAGKPLGTGACGQVFTCVWEERFPGGLLAAKVMQNEDPQVLKSFSYEAQLLAAIRHPSIVRVYGYCLEPPNVCIIMELLQGSVDDMLRSIIASDRSGKSTSHIKTSILASGSHASGTAPVSTLGGTNDTWNSSTTGSTTGPSAASGDASVQIVIPALEHAPSAWPTPSQGSQYPARTPRSSAAAALSMRRVLQIALDVASGLEYLHDMRLPMSVKWADSEAAVTEQAGEGAPGASGVLHRDLKPANILINKQGQAKICDFGIARRVEATALHTEVEWAGTTSYMAPELLAVKTNRGMTGMVTRKVDIYSLAIIMCELMCHSRAWLRPDQVACGGRPLLPTTSDPAWRADCLAALQCSPDLLDKMIELISACWHHRLDKRPSAAEVKAQLVRLIEQHS